MAINHTPPPLPLERPQEKRIFQDSSFQPIKSHKGDLNIWLDDKLYNIKIEMESLFNSSFSITTFLMSIFLIPLFIFTFAIEDPTVNLFDGWPKWYQLLPQTHEFYLILFLFLGVILIAFRYGITKLGKLDKTGFYFTLIALSFFIIYDLGYLFFSFLFLFSNYELLSNLNFGESISLFFSLSLQLVISFIPFLDFYKLIKNWEVQKHLFT